MCEDPEHLFSLEYGPNQTFKVFTMYQGTVVADNYQPVLSGSPYSSVQAPTDVEYVIKPVSHNIPDFTLVSIEFDILVECNVTLRCKDDEGNIIGEAHVGLSLLCEFKNRNNKSPF